MSNCVGSISSKSSKTFWTYSWRYAYRSLSKDIVYDIALSYGQVYSLPDYRCGPRFVAFFYYEPLWKFNFSFSVPRSGGSASSLFLVSFFCPSIFSLSLLLLLFALPSINVATAMEWAAVVEAVVITCTITANHRPFQSNGFLNNKGTGSMMGAILRRISREKCRTLRFSHWASAKYRRWPVDKGGLAMQERRVTASLFHYPGTNHSYICCFQKLVSFPFLDEAKHLVEVIIFSCVWSNLFLYRLPKMVTLGIFLISHVHPHTRRLLGSWHNVEFFAVPSFVRSQLYTVCSSWWELVEWYGVLAVPTSLVLADYTSLVAYKRPRAAAVWHVSSIELVTMGLVWFLHTSKRVVAWFHCYDPHVLKVVARSSSCFHLAFTVASIITALYLSSSCELLNWPRVFCEFSLNENLIVISDGVPRWYWYSFADGSLHDLN